MYLGNTNYEVMDTLYSTKADRVYQIDTPQSWVSTFNVIPGILSMPTMSYYSNGKPHNVAEVIVMRGKNGNRARIGTQIPSSYRRNDVAAQVVYHMQRTSSTYVEGASRTISFWDFNNQKA